MRPLRPLAPPAERAPPQDGATAPAPAAPARARPPPPPPRGDRLARARAGQRRRSALVRVLRVAAPLAMVVLAAVLVGWVAGRARHAKRAPESAAVSIHMTNPRFLGRDSHGRPFVLTGTDAVRDTRDPHQVAIVSPHLVLEPAAERVAQAAPGQAPPQPFVVTAVNGLYHDDTHLLALAGNVVVDDGRENHFFSERGEVDTDSGDVTGHDHARGVGPTGTVEGDSYALSDKGDHATFAGRVKSHLNNTKGAPPAAARKGP